ncbi:50S ribosomal protein L33 [Patescibacteria group bacterium]|nr:50S ribosomal protein L33 [Patescibacteria group bacterium]
MMAKDNREVINLECKDCGHLNYQTKKRVKPYSGEQITKLELKKYCEHCRKHREHKETK